MINGDELGRMVNFAEVLTEADAERLRNKLPREKGPSTEDASGSWVNWNQAELLGQPFDVNRIPLSKLEQMQRDPILAFGLMFIKVPLVRAPWYIKSESAERAAFIDNALRRIYGRFILSYTNSLSYGYSAMVKRFELANPDWTYIDKTDPTGEEKRVWTDKKLDAVIWKPFVSLNPRDVVPHWNAKGEFAGIDWGPGSGTRYNFLKNESRRADIPLDWAMWATNEKDSVYGSIWGYPRLGYAYRFWWSYWYKFGLADRAFEKWGDPPVVVWHPSMKEGFDSAGNPVDFGSEALSVAEKIRSGANVAMPTKVAVAGMEERPVNIKEWDITQLESKANFDALTEMFKYLDIQKLRAMMVPEQSLIEGNSSARNVAKEFGDVFQESQAVIMEEIDDQINRFMIPQLLEANFGPGGPTCTKVTTGFDPQDRETMRAIVQSFANSNAMDIPVDLRDLLERLGVPTLSQEAFLKHLEEVKKRAEEMQPPEVKANGGNAGVTDKGLYYDGREVIEFSDNEKSTLRKAFDKLLGRNEEPGGEE